MSDDPQYGAWRRFEEGCRCHNNPPCAFCLSLVDREIEVMDGQPTREKAMAALAEMVNPMDLADENYCAICGDRISNTQGDSDEAKRIGVVWTHSRNDVRDHRAYAGEKFNGSSIVTLIGAGKEFEAFVPSGLLGSEQTKMDVEYYDNQPVAIVEKLTETAHCVGCGAMISRDVWPHHAGPWYHDFNSPASDAHAAVPVEGSIMREPPVRPFIEEIVPWANPIEPRCNCGNAGNVFHENTCPMSIMIGAAPATSLGARQPGDVGYDKPEPPGVDLLGDLRVIAELGFITPDRTELHVQKKKNGDVVFIVVERESPNATLSHRATLAPGQQMKLMNLLHTPVSLPETINPTETPDFFSSLPYDMSIHSNPDAIAWAKFFVETIRQVATRNTLPARGGKWEAEEITRLVCDESYMVGWFANAMMAMHDHMGSRPIVRPSVDEIFAGLTDEDFEPDIESQKDWEIPGWMWAIFISGVLIACAMICVAISRGAL